MIKSYYLKAGRKRYHSRENWAKIGTTTSYGLSTLKVVGDGHFLFSDSGHTFTSELIFLTFLLDLGLIKKWSVITPCLSLFWLCTFSIWQEPHTECIPSIPHSYILANEKKQHLQQCANVLRKGVY